VTRKEPVFGERFHEWLATDRIVVLQVWLASAERSLRKEAAQPAGKGWQAARIVSITPMAASLDGQNTNKL
jgi:hypothetical protein